jgi:hypothetical protein
MRVVNYDTALEYMLTSPFPIQAAGIDASGKPLAIDGIHGRLTKGASYYLPSEDEHPLILAAWSYLAQGAGEIGGKDKGKWVEHFFFNRGTGMWCAAFTSRCLHDVWGDPALRFRSWGARPQNDKFARAGAEVSPDDVAPGDLITWERRDPARPDRVVGGHIGVVCYVNGGHIAVVEGNAGRDGQVRVWTYTRRSRFQRWGRDAMHRVTRPALVLGEDPP